MKRRQSKPEAAISDEMMAYQHEFVGRGPDRIRTRIVEDLVIVRSFGVLTPAERQLATSFQRRRLIKAMRKQVLEAVARSWRESSTNIRERRSSPFTLTSPPRAGSGWTSWCSIRL